jgi:hypothetical protein
MGVLMLARGKSAARDLLEDIASKDGDLAGELAWSGHTPEAMVLAWTDFKATVYALHKITTDGDAWKEYYDPEDCASTDHAIELKSAEMDDAFRYLVDGPRGGAS